MFCAECGARLTRGAEFCLGCGKPMDKVTIVWAAGEVPERPEEPIRPEPQAKAPEAQPTRAGQVSTATAGLPVSANRSVPGAPEPPVVAGGAQAVARPPGQRGGPSLVRAVAIACVAGAVALVVSMVAVILLLSSGPDIAVTEPGPAVTEPDDAPSLRGGASRRPVHAAAFPGGPERVPCVELAIREEDERLTGSFDGVGPGAVRGYLLVRNDSEVPLTLGSDFSFWDDSGEPLEGFDDGTDLVMPGEEAMLCGTCYDDAVAAAGYTLTCERAFSWYAPLDKNVEIRESSVDDKQVVLQITNVSDGAVWIRSARCRATDADGDPHAGSAFAIGIVEAGDVLEVTFDRGAMFDPDAFDGWDGLVRTYYVDGYVVST